MAVKLRLSRVGKKHAPFYRIIAIDSRSPRDGVALEVLGTFDPLKGQFAQFDAERINYWLGCGAVETDAVKKLRKLREEGASVQQAAA